ncbi:MAG TPA: hypothetical protein VHY20_09530 [Pirellulales bacterium]|nr:hypothetical protein [Pirellulales bacterium]
MARNPARLAAAPAKRGPPKWGRDSLRRAAVFASVLAGGMVLGSAIVWRALAPPSEEASVSATIEQPDHAQQFVDSEVLRKAIATGERIEVALQSVRLPKSYDLRALASRIAVRLSVATTSKDGRQTCLVTLHGVPGLTGRQSAALLNALVEQYVEDLRDARVAVATRQQAQAQARVDNVRRRLNAARSQVDELVERLSVSRPSPPAAVNLPAVLPDTRAEPSAAAAQLADAQRQWSELKARRDVLLERRTPAHPEVVEIDDRIAAAAARIDALQDRRQPAPRSSSLAANLPGGIDPEAREALNRARSASRRVEADLANAEAAQLEARDAWVQARAERRETIIPAVAPQSAAHQPTAPWLLLNFAASLLLACGAAMLVQPAAIRSAAEAQQLLGVPVIGVLPVGFEQPPAGLAAA